MKRVFVVVLLCALCSVLCATPSLAGPLQGRLEYLYPAQADVPSEDSPMVRLVLSRALGPRLTLETFAQHSLLSAGDRESRVNGRLTFDLTRDLALFGFYERRYLIGADRVVLGVAYRFRVGR